MELEIIFAKNSSNVSRSVRHYITYMPITDKHTISKKYGKPVR
jgi:hypothetical protein